MSDLQNLLDVADANKIHAEINQLRNQQFLTCSFALALYGVSFQAVDSEPLLVIPQLVVLGTMFYWHYTLRAVQVKLSTYLRKSGLSRWERDYRAFADVVKRPSQRATAAVIFVVLGAIATVVPARKLWLIMPPISNQEFLLVVAVLIAYVCSIAYLGFKEYPEKVALYNQEWDKVLDKAQRTPPTFN